MKKDLVVLAAGMGSRYGGLKQIESVGPSGERIIDYSIYDARRAGFDRVVFVIRKDMESAFREAIGRDLEKHIDVAYAYQQMDDLPGGHKPPPGREKPWGTSHAVLAARHIVTSPFAVINADDFYGASAFKLLAGHLDGQPGVPPVYAMIGYELFRTVSSHGTVARGLCRTDAAGFLVDIEEVTTIECGPSGLRSKDATGGIRHHDNKTPTSMNCWGFFPDFFARAEKALASFLEKNGNDMKAEFYLPASVGAMIARGEVRVRVLTTQDAWYGVTYREDKPAVTAGIQSMVSAGHYPSRLWQ